MDSTQARTIADFLLADFQNETKTTLGVLGAVPADHLDYSPDAKSKNALGLLTHLVLADVWFLNCISSQAFGPPSGKESEAGINTPADAIARYQETIPAALDRVRAMTDDQLAAPIDFFGMMQAPAVNFLSMAIRHCVHHRGQLSAYLRAMGGKVPGIYGPSGDM
ncbi:MAG: DUF664 domain-containing protein [Acidobacteriia bacterium]|nr:DUF664 domain-containing protein [Terriglobia bacterium]